MATAVSALGSVPKSKRRRVTGNTQEPTARTHVVGRTRAQAGAALPVVIARTAVVWVALCAARARAATSTTYSATPTTGGAHWRSHVIDFTAPGPPTYVENFNSIACWSPLACMAVAGGGVYVTTDAGATWESRPLRLTSSSTLWDLTSVACPGSQRCEAVGSIGSDTTNRGDRVLIAGLRPPVSHGPCSCNRT
jgi:hypothetical protein